MPKLPKAVEKQAELADEIYNQVYGTPKEAPPSEAPAPAAPESTDSKPTDTTEQPASAPQEGLAEPDAQAEEYPDDETVTPAEWRRRAKTAEGRLTKEQPRMAQTIRELKDQLFDAQAKIARLEADKAKPPPSPVKPEEVEQYGEDFIDMVKRVARAENPGVDGDVQKQLEQVTQRQRQVARQQFFESLNRDAPQWEKLNSNQAFLDHLAGLDPYTGRPRQELFDDAYEKLDAWRIANFFNAFSESRQQVPEPKPRSREDQVVPNASRAGAPPPPAKKMWTTSEVARFYSDVRRGAISDEDAARIESDIFAAQSEGRLR